MAPPFKQMNGPQRASRKALIGQVSNLLVKRRNPGMGKVIAKPALLGAQGRRRPSGTGVSFEGLSQPGSVAPLNLNRTSPTKRIIRKGP